jgi:hypothetical protein
MTCLAVARLCKRMASNILVSPEHRAADRQADKAKTLAQAAQNNNYVAPHSLRMAIQDDEPQLTGAKLSSLMQKQAYQGVQERMMLEYSKRPQDQPSFKDKLQAQNNCCHKNCGREDTMEYILFYCKALGCKKIWSLAKVLWEKKAPTEKMWHRIRMVLSCGLARFKAQTGNHHYGAEWLCRILVFEFEKLIWNLTLERGILEKDKTLTDVKIEAKWYTVVNERLSLDQELTNKQKYNKKALKKRYVLDTWSGTLKSEDKLPSNWAWECSVSVGIKSRLGDKVQKEEEDTT